MRGLSESEVAVLRDLLVTAGIDIESDTDLNEILDIFRTLVEERKRVTAKYDPFKYAVGINEYRIYTRTLVEERKRVTAKYDPFKYAVGINEYRIYTDNEWPDED